MKLPTNNKQKQMTLGVLKALYDARYKEGNYDKAVEIKKVDSGRMCELCMKEF